VKKSLEDQDAKSSRSRAVGMDPTGVISLGTLAYFVMVWLTEHLMRS
jgi:hypothetical protein